MCYLDAIAGPSPLEFGGIFFVVAIGALLLSGIAALIVSFLKK